VLRPADTTALSTRSADEAERKSLFKDPDTGVQKSEQFDREIRDWALSHRPYVPGLGNLQKGADSDLYHMVRDNSARVNAGVADKPDSKP